MKPPSTPRPCPICESSGERDVLHRQQFFQGPLGDGYDVVVCAACGAGFADGIPSQGELDRYYAERSRYTYAHAGGAESPYDFKRFELIADELEPLLPDKTARILDIGCATGGLLAVLKGRGYENVLGTDPSPVCAEAARRLHGVEVRSLALSEHGALGERFDAVILVGVLEHVREVRAAIAVVAGLLAPGGMIYCAQPDVQAFADCANAPFQQFSVEHVNFFSETSLVRLMAAQGLASRATWHWMVEWREGMTDSVLSGAFCLKKEEAMWSRDETTAPALRTYLAVCVRAELMVNEKIEELVRSQEPLVVWGAGSLTRHLIATTSLAQANIAVFVDSNRAFLHEQLAGRQVIAPPQLLGRSETILICSRVFEVEIRRIILHQLRLSNPIKSLFPEAG